MDNKNKKQENSFKINTHRAKSELSRLLREVEESHVSFMICRNGKVVAKLSPADDQQIQSPLVMNPKLSKVTHSADAFTSALEEDWPEEMR